MRSTGRGSLAAGIATLWLAATGAGAQTAERPAEETTQPAEQADAETSEYVEVRRQYVPASNTIATKLPVALQETPANVGVVTSALLDEQDAAVLGDALRNISGVHVEAGQGVMDYFLIRGFNSLDGGLVLTDGAAEPEATFYGMYNVEGVEVLKGPAGFLWGGNPLAGTVNMVRKQPQPVDFAVITGSAGSFATYQADLDWNKSNSDGQRAFRLNGSWRDAEGFRDDKEHTHAAINPGFALRWGQSSSLNLSLEYVDADFSPDSGVPIYNGAVANVPRERSYQLPRDFSEQAISRFQADYETRLSERVRLRNKLYFRQLDWDSDGTLINATVDPGFGALVFRTLTTLDDRQTSFGNQLEAVFELGQGRVRHQLLAGLELSSYDDDFDIGAAPPCGLSPAPPPFCTPFIALDDPQETPGPIEASPFLVGEAEQTVIAPYVVDQISFSQRFQLLLGARWDESDQDVRFDVNQQEPIAGYERSDGELSPMAGAVWAPSDTLSVYANVGRAFAPIGARVVGAATLDPEESEQAELGIKQRLLDGRMRVGVSAYRLERENIPISDDNGLTQQAGDQRSQGIEFDLGADFGSGLHAFFTYAWNDAELTRFVERPFTAGCPSLTPCDRSGNTPAFAPEHIAGLWLGKKFDGGFGLAGGARWVSEQFVAEDNAFEIDDYLVLDATAYYDFPALRLKLNVKNLTDTDYERRGFGSASVIPADPFSFMLGLECRL